MKTAYIVQITTTEEDFCKSDLREAIETGIEDVGNYTLKEIDIKEILS
jgi:hypothetical protein